MSKILGTTPQDELRELRASTGLTQKAFSEWLHIPKRTIENWEGGQSTPPDYVIELIKFRITHGKEKSE